MKIIGIDPSLTSTGVVVLVNGKIKDKYLVETKPTNNYYDEIRRLIKISESFSLDGKIDLVVVEGIAYGIKKASALAQLCGLNYLIRKRLIEAEIPFVIVAPTTLKKFITGNGTAAKEELMLDVLKRFGVTLRDNNLCDAYGLAMIGYTLKKNNPKVTKFQKEVLELLKTQIK